MRRRSSVAARQPRAERRARDLEHSHRPHRDWRNLLGCLPPEKQTNKCRLSVANGGGFYVSFDKERRPPYWGLLRRTNCRRQKCKRRRLEDNEVDASITSGRSSNGDIKHDSWKWKCLICRIRELSPSLRWCFVEDLRITLCDVESHLLHLGETRQTQLRRRGRQDGPAHLGKPCLLASV